MPEVKGLKTYRLGELIELCDERNAAGKYTDFFGLNINKEFMPTVADTNGLDATKYKIVRKNRFVFSGMQTGRDGCIRLGMYEDENPILISPAYTTFEIENTDIVLPTYFYMIFCSKEKDRYGAFCSDGSIRTNLDWERFCDFELDLPPLEVQKKYAAVYLSAKANLEAYQSRLSSLKLVCDGMIDKIKSQRSSHEQIRWQKLGDLIEQTDERNTDGKYTLADVKGISIEKKFIETKADMKDVSLAPYILVKPDYFAYVTVTSRNGGKITLAHNDSDKTYIVSSSYIVFKVGRPNELLSEYLSLLLSRPEFDRYARFCSWGSARETFDWSEMCEVQIPLPPLEVQKDIVNIYKTYIERGRIAQALKEQIKKMCPVLVRGSISEVKG